jgi:poly-gamma-glutamate synthesis protein (capsule biosynthesis protein)
MDRIDRSHAVIIRAVGDIAINRQPDDAVFADAGCLGEGADIVVGQLESVFTHAPSSGFRADASLRSDPENARQLSALGLTCLSLAGNHVMTCGLEGLRESCKTVEALGIETFGAGENIHEARVPFQRAVRGQTVSIVAANSILPPGCAASDFLPGARPLRIRTLYEMIQSGHPGTAARALTYPVKEDYDDIRTQVEDLVTRGHRVIAWMHWGLHLEPETTADYESEVGRGLIDAGCDLVIGAHQHILKGVELHKGRAIVHSLGNFCFDLDVLANPARQAFTRKLAELYPEAPTVPAPNNRLYPFSEKSRLTAVLEIVLPEGRPAEVGFRPAYIGDGGRPRLLSQDDGLFADMAQLLTSASARFGVSFVRTGTGLLRPVTP